MRKQIFIFFTCFLFFLCISAQEKYRAIQWTMEDGLSWDALNTMIKDAKGFLWIGSHSGGFCRFDGATFKKYLPDQNTPGTSLIRIGSVHLKKIVYTISG